MRSNWHPFGQTWNQLNQLQREMGQLFSRFGEDGLRSLGLNAYPPVNVWEDGDNLLVEAELPGLNLADLEIFVTGSNQLTIKGERKQTVPEKGVRHRQERGFGNFVRVLALPFAVDAEKVEARFENGVLQIKLAKHESAKPRKIRVTVAQ
jgi:HSP20 family protein